jgi:tetratricopeptide (TPR) repeat protein
VLLSCLLFFGQSFAAHLEPKGTDCQIDPALLRLVDHAIAQAILHRWAEAHAGLDSLCSQDPDDPLPWLFKSSLYAFQMTESESFAQEENFLACMVRVQENLASPAYTGSENQRDFIEGSTLAWRAYHAGRHERWFQALATGFKSAGILERLYARCPDFADLELAIGTFRFWKSARVAQFHWLPFLKDERETALIFVQSAYEEGEFNRWVAASNLCWMYLDLTWNQEAKSLALDGLRTFPHAQLFLFPLAEALLQLGEFEEADLVFSELITIVQAEVGHNQVNTFILLEKRSHCLQMMGRVSESLELGRTALDLKLSPAQRTPLKERYKRLEKRLAKIESPN